MGSELRAGKPPAFSEMACDLGENQRERRCHTSFFEGSLDLKPAFPSGFLRLRVTQHHALRRFTPFAQLALFAGRRKGEARLTSVAADMDRPGDNWRGVPQR